MHDVFSFVNITHDNDSITFSWRWGIDAKGVDAKVHVRVRTFKPLSSVWLDHSEVKVVSIISDFSRVKILYQENGIVVTFQNKSLLHGHP